MTRSDQAVSAPSNSSTKPPITPPTTPPRSSVPSRSPSAWPESPAKSPKERPWCDICDLRMDHQEVRDFLEPGKTCPHFHVKTSPKKPVPRVRVKDPESHLQFSLRKSSRTAEYNRIFREPGRAMSISSVGSKDDDEDDDEDDASSTSSRRKDTKSNDKTSGPSKSVPIRVPERRSR